MVSLFRGRASRAKDPHGVGSWGPKTIARLSGLLQDHRRPTHVMPEASSAGRA